MRFKSRDDHVRFCKNLTAIAIFIVAMLSLFAVGDAQRIALGEDAGNLVLIAQAVIIVGLWQSARLWTCERHLAAGTLFLITLGSACALAGWLIHPDQVTARAGDRLSHWESAIDEYRYRMSEGETDPKAEARVPAMAAELAARRLEYNAALVRHNGDAAFYRTATPSYVLWASTMLCVIAVIAIRRSALRDAPSSKA
jgi:hypothetical protein